MSNNKVNRGRTLARSQALQLLFQAEALDTSVERVLEGDYLISKGPLDDYAVTLATGCDVNKLAIDAALREASTNWRLERMPGADRNLLRLAVYELRYLKGPDKLDDAVVIDEAVELAKAYGTDDSSKFVNGVLGRIAGLDVLPTVYGAPRFVSDEEAAGAFRTSTLEEAEEPRAGEE